ncbi:MAG: hypothetical protein Q4B63_04560 [Clostridium perfringens]|nr:hypothetical protein [Clostridium perfringens]
MNKDIKFILKITMIYFIVSIFCAYIFSKSYYDIFQLNDITRITYNEFLEVLKEILKGIIYGGVLFLIKDSYIDKNYGFIRLFLIIMILGLINIKAFSLYTLDNFYKSVPIGFKLKGVFEVAVQTIIFSFLVAMPKSKDKNKRECLISTIMVFITLLLCNIIIYKLSNISFDYRLYKEDILMILFSSIGIFIATKWFYKTKNKKKYLIIIGVYYLIIALIPFIYSNIFLDVSFYKHGISLLINLVPVNILILYNAVSKIS